MKKLLTAFNILLMLACGLSASAQNACDSIRSHISIEHPFGYFVTDSVPLRFYYSGKDLISNPTASVELDDTSEVVIRGSQTISHISDDNDTVTFDGLKVTYKTGKKDISVGGKVKLYNPNLNPALDCEYSVQFFFHQPNTCDSMRVSPYEAYTNKANDTVIFSLVYRGNNFVNYPKISLLLNDTTDFIAREDHQFFGLQDSSVLAFRLTHKTNHIPDFLYGRLLLEDGLGNGELSCPLPVLVRFNKPNSIAPGMKDEDLKFYPNPVSGGDLNIIAPGKGHIRIMNMLGQEVSGHTVLPGPNQINLDLQPGQYIIVFTSAGEYRKGCLMVR